MPRWLRAREASRSIAEELSIHHFSSKNYLVLTIQIQPTIPRLLEALEGHAPEPFDRILFCLEGSTMVILHGFIKKQQATPKQDLDLAKERLKILKRK